MRRRCERSDRLGGQAPWGHRRRHHPGNHRATARPRRWQTGRHWRCPSSSRDGRGRRPPPFVAATEPRDCGGRRPGLTIQLNPRSTTGGGSPPGFCARSSASSISVNKHRTSASVHARRVLGHARHATRSARGSCRAPTHPHPSPSPSSYSVYRAAGREGTCERGSAVLPARRPFLEPRVDALGRVVRRQQFVEVLASRARSNERLHLRPQPGARRVAPHATARPPTCPPGGCRTIPRPSRQIAVRRHERHQPGLVPVVRRLMVAGDDRARRPRGARRASGRSSAPSARRRRRSLRDSRTWRRRPPGCRRSTAPARSRRRGSGPRPGPPSAPARRAICRSSACVSGSTARIGSGAVLLRGPRRTRTRRQRPPRSASASPAPLPRRPTRHQERATISSDNRLPGGAFSTSRIQRPSRSSIRSTSRSCQRLGVGGRRRAHEVAAARRRSRARPASSCRRAMAGACQSAC